jgi:hypothetical protein
VACPGRETCHGGQTPQVEACSKYVKEKRPCVRAKKGGHGLVEIKLLCFRWLSPLSVCRRGFQDVLKVRPSSLFMLCECISSSIASLISQSMYLVFAERVIIINQWNTQHSN